jgi:hypothetical protein
VEFAADSSRTDLVLRSLADAGWSVTIRDADVGVFSLATHDSSRVLTYARSRQAVVVLLAQYAYAAPPPGDPSNS